MNIARLILIIATVLMAVSAVAAKESILVIRKNGEEFEDVLKGLSDELHNEFVISDKVISKKSSVDDIKSEINSQNPKLVVLMDNTSISLFKKYQLSLSSDEKVIPSIALMGVLIKNAISEIKNIEGISYEIPVVTSIINLRNVLDIKIKKVGIIHRQFYNDFLNENKTYCEKEGVVIVNIELPNKCNDIKGELKKGLNTIVTDKEIDALWVPNDNALLQPEIIRDVWIPLVKKSKKPVIVGVEILVNPKLDFGIFAVLPDNISLGTQAAEMIYDIMDNDWICTDKKVEPPLAVYKIINLNQAQNYKITIDKLKAIDKKVK